MKSKILAIIAIAFVLVSCKKDQTDKTENSGFTFQLRAVNPVSTMARTMATISWQSGFANASLIKFEAKQGGNEVEFKSNVQRHIDLFALPTDIGNISVPAGTYDETEFKITIAPAAAEPAFQLEGSFNNIPVIFKVEDSYLIKAEQHQVVLTGSNIALTTLDFSGLTADIAAADFTSASQINGTIVISSSSNTSLYKVLLSNLHRLGEAEAEIEIHHRH